MADSPTGRPEQVLRIHARTILAALAEAAEACRTHAEAWCHDCAEQQDAPCDTHTADLARADDYDRAHDELAGALGLHRAAPHSDTHGPRVAATARHLRLVHGRPGAGTTPLDL